MKPIYRYGLAIIYFFATVVIALLLYGMIAAFAA